MTAPNEEEIEAALATHLAALNPPWRTKLPGVAFSHNGLSHQLPTWMPGEPMPVAMGQGAYHRLHGVYQITVAYPKSERRVDLLLARARLVREHFYPANARGYTITAGAGEIYVERRPSVSRIDESDASFNRVFVSVYVRIEMPPA